MRMRSGAVTRLLGLALVLLIGLAAQASAGTFTATFKGTVKSGSDSKGLFGTPGDLTGADYTLVFSIDPKAGDYSTFDGTISDPAVKGDQIFGGVSAVLTIKGHDYAIAAGSGSYDIAAHKPGFGQVMLQAGGGPGPAAVYAWVTMSNPGPDFPTSVLTGGSITSCVTCTVSINFSSFYGYAALNLDTLRIVTTPLPAGLPLLVTALGGLGWVGWRRRQSAAA